MRVEVFSPEAVRVWKGWLWWKRYREAVLLPSKSDKTKTYWYWVDTEAWVGSEMSDLIDDTVDDWYWKQPGQIPTAIVVRKKEGK